MAELNYMYKGVANSPDTFLSEPLASGGAIIYVADYSVFGNLPTLAVIGSGANAETILIKSKRSDQGLDVKRAIEGVARDWPKATTIARNFTNYDYNQLVENINKLNVSKIDAPTGGTVGQVLKKTETGTTWGKDEKVEIVNTDLTLQEDPSTHPEDKVPSMRTLVKIVKKIISSINDFKQEVMNTFLKKPTNEGTSGQILKKSDNGSFWTNETKTTIINDLTTGGVNSALSAEQGKVLKIEVDTKLKTPTGGAVGNVLKKTSSGVEWGEAASQAIVKANDTTDGLMSKEDFKKLKDWNGVTSSSADANTLTAAGIYSVRSSANLPSSAGKYGSLIVLKCDTTTNNVQTDTMQVYFDQNNDIYIRNSVDKSDNTWTNWKQVGGSGSSESKQKTITPKIFAAKEGKIVSLFFDSVSGSDLSNISLPMEFRPAGRISFDHNSYMINIVNGELSCSGTGYLGYPVITYVSAY